MVLAGIGPYRAKHVTAVQFGNTIWSEADLASSVKALDTNFATNNPTVLLDLVGTPDTNAPTKSYAFAKNFAIDGNELGTSEEYLLGLNTASSQNMEMNINPPSKIEVSFDLIYRNPVPLSLFNSNTKACIVSLNNVESATAGELHFAFNNVNVTHAGSLKLNPDGMMEQKVKFVVRSGIAGSSIAVAQTSPATETWYRIRAGLDYAEEIRTA